MSIAPPSDIIFDVAQAADPQKLQAATSRLARTAGGAVAGGFEAALDAGAVPTPNLAGKPALPFSATAVLTHPALESRQASTDRKFEAMVLQNFIENIMPKDAELFGDAASADMCRSLLAEQISSQLARTGRFGIAKSLEHFQDTPREAVSLPSTMPSVPTAGPPV